MPSNDTHIIKDQKLKPAEDYQRLRKLGLSHIEKMSSDIWTDYNVHDPGITTLEMLCYALTDLGYRTSFDVKDLIASEDGKSELFTARTILTNNATTINDLRKLIIDIQGVKNAWIQLSEKQEKDIWIDCDKSILTFNKKTDFKSVELKGLYHVTLELDDDELLGDLNRYSIDADHQGIEVTVNYPGWDYFFARKMKPSTWIFDGFNYLSYEFGTKTHRAEVLLKKGAKTLNLPVTFIISGPRKLAQEQKIKDHLQTGGAERIWASFSEKIEKALKIVDQVCQKTHLYRNLCEDYQSYKGIDVEDIIVCADIEVKPDAEIEAVYGEIIHQVAQYIAPDIRFYSLKELLRKKLRAENIFDGPALDHGFILNEDLEKAALRKVIYTSDIVNIIMDIEGVVAIRNIELASLYQGLIITEGESWCLEITSNRAPRLHQELSNLEFYKGLIPYFPDRTKAKTYLKDKELSLRKGKMAFDVYDLETPKGRFLPLADYTTIQNDFPLTYGVGDKGIPGLVDEQRKAQAKQFKGFLAFFDQILSNYLSQLSNIRQLFSFDDQVKRTYFFQVLYQVGHPPAEPDFVLEEVPEYYKLVRRFVENLPSGTDIDEFESYKINWDTFRANFDNDFIKSLSNIVEDEDTFLDRRNRFLDHLMGRFAEQFTDYVLLMFQLQGKQNAQKDLVVDKQLFLKQYPELSRDRFRAFNYKDCPNLWDTDNIAGLAKRLCRLAGIDDSSRRYLHCPQAESYFNMYKDTVGEWRFNLKNSHSDILLKSEGYKQKASAKNGIDSVLRNGDEFPMYQLLKSGNGKYYYNLKAKNGEIIGTSVLFASEEDRNAVVNETVELLAGMCEAEGMHLVEHLLLRPLKSSHAFMPVCVDKGCKNCLGFIDPYSFRITLVLPAWVRRFRSMDFRRYFEDLARKETPAHIHVKICWVDHHDMMLFEQAYKSWLESRCLAKPDEPQAQRDLVDALAEIRSVYPVATLHDCSEGDNENPLILGNTVLGSTKFQ